MPLFYQEARDVRAENYYGHLKKGLCLIKMKSKVGYDKAKMF